MDDAMPVWNLMVNDVLSGDKSDMLLRWKGAGENIIRVPCWSGSGHQEVVTSRGKPDHEEGE